MAASASKRFRNLQENFNHLAERRGGWGGGQGQRRRFVYVFPVDFEYLKKYYETLRILYDNVEEEESK